MSDLSEKEIEDLKKLLTYSERIETMIQQDERVRWLWMGVKRILLSVAAIVGAVSAFWDEIQRLAAWWMGR